YRSGGQAQPAALQHKVDKASPLSTLRLLITPMLLRGHAVGDFDRSHAPRGNGCCSTLCVGGRRASQEAVPTRERGHHHHICRDTDACWSKHTQRNLTTKPGLRTALTCPCRSQLAGEALRLDREQAPTGQTHPAALQPKVDKASPFPPYAC